MHRFCLVLPTVLPLSVHSQESDKNKHVNHVALCSFFPRTQRQTAAQRTHPLETALRNSAFCLHAPLPIDNTLKHSPKDLISSPLNSHSLPGWSRHSNSSSAGAHVSRNCLALPMLLLCTHACNETIQQLYARFTAIGHLQPTPSYQAAASSTQPCRQRGKAKEAALLLSGCGPCCSRHPHALP